MNAHVSIPGAIPGQRPREAVPVNVARAPVASDKEPAVCPTDDEAQVPRKATKDKQSVNYVMKSGIAGGMAGCAVRYLRFLFLFRL